MHAQNGTWITTGGGNWTDAIIADGSDNTASFTADISSTGITPRGR